MNPMMETTLAATRLSSVFVDEFLKPVQALLHVDTVTVLLLERDRSHLVARWAVGLEEEVYQGVRVPVGRGFAGRVALTRAPVTIDNVGPDAVVNPILWRRGLQSMLGVPLTVQGRLLGVIHVGSLERRRFGEDEIATLQSAAERIALAVSLQQGAEERTAARTLQESLLPTELPEVEGLEFASRFVTAETFGVGGDWFDAFKLPDDRIGIVIGDVAGAGLRAAVVMGRLRSALRAYAVESETPGEALARLHRKFAHFEPSEMATVLYVVVAADLSGCTVASLGHLPPVIALPGHDVAFVACTPSPPIGAPLPSPPVDARHPLEAGTTVGCYTDGLVERRWQSIDDGLEQLRAAFFAGDPEDVCAAVMSDLIGTSAVQDDTALLVFRRV
jgi:sigma-B regulation protein RsbU (phosphoserine phosphatase)